MFLAFGSLVLPVKAAIMSALTLGSTLGVLTWIFVDGHLSTWLNFTPTPLTAPVIGLVIAVVYGLSTDYEVFLVARMVEARDSGASTADAIRIGTATTGRLITAAALVLVVVAGAFVFSDLVMMKYLAFGLVTALLLDATVVRMFLVPAVMKLLGDECWWAPLWLKRLHARIGLGEIGLPAERKPRVPPATDPEESHEDDVLVGAGASVTELSPHGPNGSEVAAPGSTPSLATSTPMHDLVSTGGEGAIPLIPTADDSESPNGDEPAVLRAVPTALQQDPDAT
jgi:RND superfamily putative drug exporter